MWRQIVGEPFVKLAQEFRLARPDLLLEFAKRCLFRSLAVVNAALRHLPAFYRLIDTLADKDEALSAQQHDAYAWPVGQVFVLQVQTVARHMADAELTRRK